MEVSLEMLWSLTQSTLEGVEDGSALTAAEESLIRLGVAAAVTSLDPAAIEDAVVAACAEGASAAQMQEVVSLVSGLGVHSLMATAKRIADITGAGAGARTPAQQALWDRYVGADPYWIAFDAQAPGFLDALLGLSGEQFSAFFDYCAVPWKTGAVRARLKELIALATDATPTHRFLPGFKLHLSNALTIGVGRLAIERTLQIAASAPPHRGTW